MERCALFQMAMTVLPSFHCAPPDIVLRVNPQAATCLIGFNNSLLAEVKDLWKELETEVDAYVGECHGTTDESQERECFHPMPTMTATQMELAPASPSPYQLHAPEVTITQGSRHRRQGVAGADTSPSMTVPSRTGTRS